MTSSHPPSFNDIRAWAKSTGIPTNEARVRFAQYSVLQSIAAVGPLRDGLVFKGGNALDFVWQPNRSTIDLDFSVDHTSSLAMPDAETLQTLLQRGIPVASSRLGIILAVQRVGQIPEAPTSTSSRSRPASGTLFPIKLGCASAWRRESRVRKASISTSALMS